jgi:hypothetical protein
LNVLGDESEACLSIAQRTHVGFWHCSRYDVTRQPTGERVDTEVLERAIHWVR